MPLIDLLKKVRIEGGLKTRKNIPFDQNFPIIIGDEKGYDGVTYFNSGGRSIIFEYMGRCHRVKGVDPYGILTRKVAKSKQNKITDVNVGYVCLSQPSTDHNRSRRLIFVNGKPFGVILKNEAENEKVAFEILDTEYKQNQISTPCKYVDTYKVYENEMQNLYEIPSLDSDLRLEEFNQLLRERLNKCDAKELEQKTRQIFKLYHRILTWVGWDIRMLIGNKLKPSPRSWVPQNHIISKVDGGYGIFRVDHTSTVLKEDLEAKSVMDNVFDGLEGPGFGTFTKVPTGMLIGVNYKLATGKKPKRKKPLFEQGFNYKGKVSDWKKGYGYFLKILGFSLMAGVKLHELPNPIPEYMFREALA